MINLCGGNRFLVEFISHLRSKNIPVAYRKDEATVEMFEKHLDDTAMFFLLEPTDLYTSDNNNISFDSVFEKIRQRDIKLVQRIGNVGSHRNINFYLAAFETCAKYIDCAIFTSEWALNQVSAAGIHYKHSIVIRNVAKVETELINGLAAIMNKPRMGINSLIFKVEEKLFI